MMVRFQVHAWPEKTIGWEQRFTVLAWLMGISIRVARQMELSITP